jgi:hypothetical protein
METITKETIKMLLALAVAALLFYAVSAWADHNYDPDIPATQIDRGYNKENCEKWETEDEHGRKWKGHWLGHLVGCLMDGKIYGEFTVTEAKAL